MPNGAAKSKVTLSQLGWSRRLTLFCDKSSSNTSNAMLLPLLYERLKVLANYQSCSRRELVFAIVSLLSSYRCIYSLLATITRHGT